MARRMPAQCVSVQRLRLPATRPSARHSVIYTLTCSLECQASQNPRFSSQKRPFSPPAAPLWRRGLFRTAQTLFGAFLVAVASDILQFLGSKPPWDAEEWRSLTMNLDPDLTLPAPKRINPTIIYDKNKVEIARFASNAIPLNQVRLLATITELVSMQHTGSRLQLHPVCRCLATCGRH